MVLRYIEGARCTTCTLFPPPGSHRTARVLNGSTDWNDEKLNLLGEYANKAVIPPGISLIHFMVWKRILIELIAGGLSTKAFSQDTVLKAAAKRLERRLKTAEMERLKTLQRANARNEKPNFSRLQKWLDGTGALVDDRIVLHETVVDFINIAEKE